MTKSEALAKSAQITGVILQLLLAKQQADNVLLQAHQENWAEDDPRWAEKFAAADDALAKAQARL